MSVTPTRTCWCGGALAEDIDTHYRRCCACGAAVLDVLPSPRHFDVADDERDFYGKRYWTDYSRARDLPEIGERARTDLSERCLFWLERLLEVARPPGRILEIGCGHGAFVRLAQEPGFDAVGTELSGWVAEFARRSFGVRVLQGPLERLDLEPGFACIAAFDVLEHLADPLETLRRCRDLLAADGVLLLQTPWYRGEGAGWSMFQPDEHIHLFTEASVRLLLERAGFRGTLVRPSLFSYDMWVVVTRERERDSPAEVAAGRDWRLPAAFRSLLDVSHQLEAVRRDLAGAEADRAARLRQIEELTDLAHRLEAERREEVGALTAQLREAEADRAARLGQIEELGELVQGLEAARTEEARARQKDVDTLSALLREAEVDRAARLANAKELARLLRDSEADRAARLQHIEELGRQLREAEADRAARLEVIQKLHARIAEMERTWAWRVYRAVPSALRGEKSAG